MIFRSSGSGAVTTPLWFFQAPRPSTGPHKLRECLPLIIFLRNRLKYALTGDEVKKICMQRFIKIDGKVRTDITYPTGFMGERAAEGCGWRRSDQRKRARLHFTRFNRWRRDVQ